MALDAGVAYLDVLPKLSRDFGRSLSTQVAAPAGTAGAQAGERASRGFRERFTGGLKVLSGTGVVAGLYGLERLVSSSVRAAEESRKVGKQTAAVLASTGGAAGVSATQVGAYATKLSMLTGIDDEVVASGENMLLTFTNVRNGVGAGNDIFNQATKTVLDMSVALGQDAPSSAIQLGKALNDPIRGVSALQRVGVTFTASQKDQIKALVDSGKTMAAQKLILAELGKEFGGSAAAAATPLERLKVVVGNTQEAIGGLFLPVIDKASTYLAARLPGATARAQGWIARLGAEMRSPSFQAFAADLREKIGPAVDHLRDLVGKLGPGLADLATGSVPQLASALNVGAMALGFAADHTDLLVKALPFLAAGFLAVKAGQLAANVAQLASIPLKITEIAVNRQLIRSNREMIAARAGNTAATVTGTVATSASTAATGTSTLATIRARSASLASAAAARVMAAGQWLLNAALSANPIGLVIVGLAALVAGIVIAYRRSETFRNIVQGAFRAVAVAARFLWEGVLRPTFRFIVGAFLDTAGAILHGAVKAFGWIIPGVGDKLRGAARSFDAFRDDVNSSLDGIHNRTVTVKLGVNAPQVAYTKAGFITGVTGTGGRARGGPIVGPGTATSDSIYAPMAGGGRGYWLSDGEFVVNAKAYAANRSLVEAINASGLARGGPVGDAGAAPGVRVVPGVGSIAPVDAFAASVNTSLASIAAALAKQVQQNSASSPAGAGGGPAFDRVFRVLQSRLGTPYSWGGGGPYGPSRGFGAGANTVGWDCSSFMQYGFWQGAGKLLPRTSRMQATVGRAVGSAAPGDLVFYGTPVPTGVHHVGMAVGGGRYVNEPHTGSAARISSMSRPDAVRRLFDAGGFLAPGLTLAENRTGREEVVSPQPLLERLIRSAVDGGGKGAGKHYEPHFHYESRFTEADYRRAQRRMEIQAGV